MIRKIAATIDVDEETAFEEMNDGPIAYLEREFGWLDESEIRLDEAFIVDNDEDDKWQAYINYLISWAFEHRYDNDEYERTSPVSFAEWQKDKF